MQYTFTQKKRFRRTFSTYSHTAQVPELLQLQINSYKEFLQADATPSARRDVGLQNAFKTIFPIFSNSGVISLVYKSYEIIPPVYSVQECKDRELTYMGKINARIEMVTRERKGGAVKNVKEERVYMGDLPMMTEHGSFIINGTERVVVSQLHRSPGVYFNHDDGRASPTKKRLYDARIIPYTGRWLDFEFDHHDIVFFRIDRRRKMPVTILLKAMGYSVEEILREFFDFDEIHLGGAPGQGTYLLNPLWLRSATFPFDIVDDRGGVIVEKEQRVKKGDVKKIAAKKDLHYPVPDSFFEGKRLACDIASEDGEVLAKANTAITEDLLAQFRAAGVDKIQTLFFNDIDRGPYISNTLVEDKGLDTMNSRTAIYRVLRPGEPPSEDSVNTYLDGIFFNSSTYSLSGIGRMKMNHRLDPARAAMEYRIWVPKDRLQNKSIIAKAAQALVAAGVRDSVEEAQADLAYIQKYDSGSVVENMSWDDAQALSKKLRDVPHEVLEQTTLSSEDVLQVVKVLVGLRNGSGKTDDIDSLTNRRIRTVGEFVANQFQLGLVRVDRAIRDRLSRAEMDNLMPHDLISAKAVSSAVMEFFNGNQLSQFMDQTNPLSAITHKRRVSALGAGGLTRDRVGFEVRDVHPTHYGRVCPIETPEGQNIGLINSMAMFSDVNDYGFLQSRYRRVVDGRVTDEVVGLSAIEEENRTMVQADTPRDARGKISQDSIIARRDGEYILVSPQEVDYMDVSPAQITSVAASMIPFLEHDDANRALMGSNMQRQAVPCLVAEKPLVGTGVEGFVALDAGTVVRARRAGEVVQVDANQIVISVAKKAMTDDDPLGVDIYTLSRRIRSNQDTDINQHPIVRVGDKIRAGDVIADGTGTDLGELALGQNLLVAFLPWNGYNFEDSILISEKVLQEQRFTSLHIIEESVHARSMQLGDEEITRDIPTRSEAELRNLDEEGIVQVGVEVHPGDILVGKLTPKSEQQPSPEEKLLQAVFGEKAQHVKDTSLRMPPGSSGVVIDVKVFTGEEIRKKHSKRSDSASRRAAEISNEEIETYNKRMKSEMSLVEQDAVARIRELLAGKISAKDASALTKPEHWFAKRCKDEATNKAVEKIAAAVRSERRRRDADAKEMRRKIIEGHDLKQGVLKTVRVYIAIKRPLQAGDKMAGRHGNKGVVSKIEAVESMPYLADGTPVDVVLNPLGVPSRMNVGQILETHLGFAAKGLGWKINELFYKQKKEQAKLLRQMLSEIYKDDPTCNLDDLTNDELLELARNLKDGVPFATPVFDGASEAQIGKMLELAGLPTSGQVTLYDGRSGEPFDRPVTVGYMYVLKLHHLVDEKMHARATGPYSLVTQQPLGGKAQGGGQRFGEMEVWALEAYGAAYTLCEMLTIKSDDTNWRKKMFESLTEGDYQPKFGTPESFNVLMKEIRSLGIDIDTTYKREE